MGRHPMGYYSDSHLGRLVIAVHSTSWVAGVTAPTWSRRLLHSSEFSVTHGPEVWTGDHGWLAAGS